MKGRLNHDQGQLFYSFRLEQVVPEDHLVRKIAAFVDLAWVRKELAPYYSSTGRPSIDPELMIRMLIVGYVFAIRSERRICAEVQVNLAHGGFASSVSRTGFPIIRCSAVRGMSAFVRAMPYAGCSRGWSRRASRLGLSVAKRFPIDASLIKADVDKKKRLCGDQLPGRRVRKHRMRFGNTSLLSMPPAMKMRAIAVGMAVGRTAASVEASRLSKFH